MDREARLGNVPGDAVAGMRRSGGREGGDPVC